MSQVDILLSLDKWLREKHKETETTAGELDEVRQYVFGMVLARDRIEQAREVGALFVAKLYELQSRINELETELLDQEGGG